MRQLAINHFDFMLTEKEKKKKNSRRCKQQILTNKPKPFIPKSTSIFTGALNVIGRLERFFLKLAFKKKKIGKQSLETTREVLILN